MSERASASFPSICSGDMYWMVPMMLPAEVSGLTGLGPLKVRAAVNEGADPDPVPVVCSPSGLASPKSISFAPPWVSMMFPGFKSRCTMPCRCATASASATAMPILKISFSGIAPLRNLSARVSPSQKLHHQIVGSILRADVIEMTDVRVVQRGNGPRLALHALFQFWRRRKMRSKNLDGDSAIQTRVQGTVHLSHTASAER